MNLTKNEISAFENLIKKAERKKVNDNEWNRDSYYIDAHNSESYIIEYSSDGIDVIRELEEKMKLNITDEEQNIVCFLVAMSKKYIENEYEEEKANNKKNINKSELPEFIYNF